MSRILKASYVVIDDGSVAIDNSFNQPILNEKLQEQQNFNEEPFIEDDFLRNNNISEQSISEDNYQEIKENILNEATIKAEEIIEQAKNEAKNIIEQAKIEIDEQADEVYQKSREEGYTKGYEDGLLELDTLKKNAENIVLEAIQEKEELQKQIEPEIINLVIDITQKILTNSFEIDPSIISLLIKKGLQNVKELKNMNICVSEAQYDFVLENKETITRLDVEKNNIKIVKDNSLENDDCIIETEFGDIRCSVKEQFSAIKEALYYILG